MVETPVFDIDLDAIAESVRDNLPPEIIRDSRELVERLHGQAITCMGRRVIDIFRENLDIMGFTPDAGELSAWARALDCDPDIVLVANLWSDYRLEPISLGPCVAAVSERGPFLAKAAGWDEQSHPGGTVHALRFHRRGVPRFQLAGHPGLVGSTAGCSANGFALALAWLDQRCRFPFNEPLMLGMRRALEEINEEVRAFQWCEWLLPMDSDVASAFAGAWEFPPIRFTRSRTLNSLDAWRGGCLVASRITGISQLPGHQGRTPWGGAPTPIQEDQAIQRLMDVCAQEGLSPTQVVLMHPREYKLSVFRIPAMGGTGLAPGGDHQAERACDQ